MFKHIVNDVEVEHLINKHNLLNDIKIRKEIYGMTVEEMIQIIEGACELEADRYGDCWNCFDDGNCENCKENENEIRGLEQEITKLKKEV